MASESFASGFDHGRSRPCLSKPGCEPRTCCAPFALRFLPGLSLTVPASEAAHLPPATMERRSFLRLQSELAQAGEGLGTGLDTVLFDPTVQRFKLSRLEADHD